MINRSGWVKRKRLDESVQSDNYGEALRKRRRFSPHNDRTSQSYSTGRRDDLVILCRMQDVMVLLINLHQYPRRFLLIHTLFRKRKRSERKSLKYIGSHTLLGYAGKYFEDSTSGALSDHDWCKNFFAGAKNFCARNDTDAGHTEIFPDHCYQRHKQVL